jgi:hypothetical protein
MTGMWYADIPNSQLAPSKLAPRYRDGLNSGEFGSGADFGLNPRRQR